VYRCTMSKQSGNVTQPHQSLRLSYFMSSKLSTSLSLHVSITVTATPSSRGSQSSTSQFNVKTFCGIRCNQVTKSMGRDSSQTEHRTAP